VVEKVMPNNDYYKILEIPPTSSLKEVKSAYRRMAMKYHPDKNPGKESWAEDRFKEINEAYEALTKESPNLRVDINDIFRSFNFGDIFGIDPLSRFRDFNSTSFRSNISLSFEIESSVGSIKEEDVMEIRRMLASRGYKVIGHSLRGY